MNGQWLVSVDMDDGQRVLESLDGLAEVLTVIPPAKSDLLFERFFDVRGEGGIDTKKFTLSVTHRCCRRLDCVDGVGRRAFVGSLA